MGVIWASRGGCRAAVVVVVVWDVSRLVARVGGAGRCRASAPPARRPPWSYRVESRSIPQRYVNCVLANIVYNYQHECRYKTIFTVAAPRSQSTIRRESRDSSRACTMADFDSDGRKYLSYPRRRTMKIRGFIGTPSLIFTKQVTAVPSCVLWVYVGPP
jgi:hypothetical protein